MDHKATTPFEAPVENDLPPSSNQSDHVSVTLAPSAAGTLQTQGDADQARAKRGRRGGRRRRKPGEDEAPSAETAQVDPPFLAYVGPTPADPFALGALDILMHLSKRR